MRARTRERKKNKRKRMKNLTVDLTTDKRKQHDRTKLRSIFDRHLLLKKEDEKKKETEKNFKRRKFLITVSRDIRC